MRRDSSNGAGTLFGKDAPVDDGNLFQPMLICDHPTKRLSARRAGARRRRAI
jgi:hypothetical protein